MIKPWLTVGSRPVGDFRIFTLRADRKVSPRNGSEHEVYVMDSVDWVNVIAVTPNDELVMIDDAQIKDAMGFLFRNMKMAVEPACAATTAALTGPLRNRFSGKRIVLVLCGSNIDWQTYAGLANLVENNAD